jgi:hypothetical protein
MTAIYLNTIDDCGRYRQNVVKRTFVIALAMIAMGAVSQPFWAQTKFPVNPNAQKAKIAQTAQTKQAAAIAETSVPNLLWLPRESALTVLRNSHLQPEKIADDNQPGSVVIEQIIAAGTKVIVNSKVGYTIGQPVLKLEAGQRLVRVHGNVHFKVTLTPPAKPANAEGSPVVYEFVWRRGEPSSQETTDTFDKKAPNTPGTYAAMISTIVNDVPLESRPVEIKVEPTPIKPTPPQLTPTPSPVQQTKLPKAILLLVAILGTLAAAYGFHKLKKRQVAASARVKVSTGNRQSKAKILEPQSLKSKCLTRVRWVRGPLFSTMLPQEKIVKKKGAAHG